MEQMRSRLIYVKLMEFTSHQIMVVAIIIILDTIANYMYAMERVSYCLIYVQVMEVMLE